MKSILRILYFTIIIATIGLGISSCSEKESGNIAVESIEFKVNTIEIAGLDVPNKLEFTITPEEATNQNVIWNSSNDEIVTVKDGIITSAGYGEAIITVTTEDGGFSDKCTVKVQKLAKDMELNVSSLEMVVGGDKKEIIACAIPEGTAINYVNWSVNNESVVRIIETKDNKRILIEAIFEGQAVLTAKSGDFIKTCNIKSYQPVISIYDINDVNNYLTNITLSKGQTITIAAKLTPEIEETGEVIWNTANSNIIQINPIDNKQCQLTAVEGGTTSITAIFEKYNIEKNISITVQLDPPEDATYLVKPNGKPANCYIVKHKSGEKYSLPLVKGNDMNLKLEGATTAEVVWETNYSNITMDKELGIVISDVKIENQNYLSFTMGKKLGNEGSNALIAVKDSQNKILWSWHIWVIKDGEDSIVGQVYNNNAGTMMDRNLGATSTTPGHIGTYGLYYQWGRKDPFIGTSSVNSKARERTTNNSVWKTEDKSSYYVNLDYSIQYPTTFITDVKHYTSWIHESPLELKLWDTTKTIYDPCPDGWQIPEGDIWAKALNKYEKWGELGTDPLGSYGLDFSTTADYTLSSDGPVWYPSSGYIKGTDGEFEYIGTWGFFRGIYNNFGTRLFKYSIRGAFYPYEFSTNCAVATTVRCKKTEI